ncbi:hypothetical protein ALO78_102578 [Pseudomonas amygdali pv. ciccaronei]|nr:hypothetical protein ALO78_102578 [Pseudomonas amygdali pv. ciccaronei]
MRPLSHSAAFRATLIYCKAQLLPPDKSRPPERCWDENRINQRLLRSSSVGARGRILYGVVYQLFDVKNRQKESEEHHTKRNFNPPELIYGFLERFIQQTGKVSL